MKKSFSKKLMILAFAFGGLFMIGNNVFATDPNDGEDPGDGPNPMGVICTWGFRYTGEGTVATYCGDCLPRLMYAGSGDYGTCFR